LVGEFEDPAFISVLALHGQGFMSVPTVVAKDVVTRYGLSLIGRSKQCQQQFYAISAERKLTHPAVVATTSAARRGLFVEK
jgi:LysR family transcriptional activator of nhaA